MISPRLLDNAGTVFARFEARRTWTDSNHGSTTNGRLHSVQIAKNGGEPQSMWPGKTLIRRARLYQVLATALDAGLGIEQALDLASERSPSLPVESLSDILRQDQRIPELEARVLSAAEIGGVLPGVLTQLADLLEDRAAALRQLAVRLLYPVLLLHAAAILPDLRWLILGDLGNYLEHVVPTLLVFWGLGAGVAVALIWGRGMLRKSPGFAAMLASMPVVGGLIQTSGAATYASLLSMLLAAGVPLGTALKDAAQCCGNAEFAASGLRITERVIRHGDSLTTAFSSESRTWPQLLTEAIRTGEATGRLEETLAGAARGLRQEAERHTATLLTVLPIVVYLGAAVYVAWVVINSFTSFYSAI